jgi:hypothetical protein
MTAFSKGAISVPRPAILRQGGGHAANMDGAFYRFDIQGIAPTLTTA